VYTDHSPFFYPSQCKSDKKGERNNRCTTTDLNILDEIHIRFTQPRIIRLKSAVIYREKNSKKTKAQITG